MRPTAAQLELFDKLTLSDIELWLRIGITAAERECPQRLLVSADLYCDTSRAGASDDLEDSVDYAAVQRAILQAQELFSTPEQSCSTIEFLAELLANHLLASFPLQAIGIQVKKFPLPHVREVSIQIRRLADQP